MDLFSAIDTEPVRKRMEQLAEEIDRLNYEYYMNDRSQVSDFEFDAMLRELQDLERQYPELASPLSPTKRVGGEVNKSFRQVQHRFPMLSLGNTYPHAQAAGRRTVQLHLRVEVRRCGYRIDL